MTRTAVYPGSFNPPTTAHLAISEAARQQRSIDEVVWMVSRQALAKAPAEHPPFESRIAVLEEVASAVEWLRVAVTDAQLLVDIATGFDLLIMGADKWDQINELRWYDGMPGRDAAIKQLPELAIAPRPPHVAPNPHRLELAAEHQTTSSTDARNGSSHLMLPQALDSQLWT